MQRRWPVFLCGVALVAGACDVWKFREAMNPDGVSYLDLADAVRLGRWGELVNGHWSPLYPVVLAAVLAVLHPMPEREFAAAHVANFGIYVVALAAFHFFLRELLRFRRPLHEGNGSSPTVPAREPWLETLGYVLFTWCSLKLINTGLVSPDLLVTALVYAACGVVLRMRRESPHDSLGGAAEKSGRHTPWAVASSADGTRSVPATSGGSFPDARLTATLGLLCGSGYLAKTPFLPFGLVLIGCASAGAGRFRDRACRALLAVSLMLAVAAPWIAALSCSKGRLTIGDSAQLNYVWYVGRVQPPQRTHPIREIFTSPPIYEFATPVHGTYPPWRDPAYWDEGVQPRFDPERQWARLVWNCQEYWELFTGLLDGFAMPALIALVAAACWHRGWRVVADLAACWFVIVPGATAMAMFAVVLVEPRYVCGFVVVMLTASFAGLRLPPTRPARVALWGVALVAFAILLRRSPHPVRTAALVLLGIASLAAVVERFLRRPTRPAFATGLAAAIVAACLAGWRLSSSFGRAERPVAETPDQRFVRELRQSGVPSGERIAVIGGPCSGFYWARLARVQIVAELYEQYAARFWGLDAASRARALDAFRSSGAAYVLSMRPPPPEATDRWSRIGTSNRFVYDLSAVRDARELPAAN
jgi:hypothetical protein